MALQGLDLSKCQQNLVIGSLTPRPDFVIIKATEGTGYVSPTCDKHYQQARLAGVARGIYHWARPDLNSAEAEAEYFVRQCHGYLKDALLALDWEQSGQTGKVSWAKAWLDKVYALTGVRPLIYMSSSVVNGNDWSSVAKDYGLWVANYGVNNGKKNTKPTVKYWQTIAIWQYTSVGHWQGYSGNLDLDEFYGDKAAWDKYANLFQSGTGSTTENSSVTQKEGDEMKTLEFLGCKNFEEAERKLIEHLGIKGDKCSWGTDEGDGTGGFLGSERRKVKQLESQVNIFDQALVEKNKIIDALQKSVNANAQTVDRLRGQLNAAQVTIDSNSKLIDQYTQEIKDLKAQHASCKSEAEVADTIFGKLRKLIGF